MDKQRESKEDANAASLSLWSVCDEPLSFLGKEELKIPLVIGEDEEDDEEEVRNTNILYYQYQLQYIWEQDRKSVV